MELDANESDLPTAMSPSITSSTTCSYVNVTVAPCLVPRSEPPPIPAQTVQQEPSISPQTVQQESSIPQQTLLQSILKSVKRAWVLLVTQLVPSRDPLRPRRSTREPPQPAGHHHRRVDRHPSGIAGGWTNAAPVPSTSTSAPGSPAVMQGDIPMMPEARASPP
jgi:hypothetical protein